MIDDVLNKFIQDNINSNVEKFLLKKSISGIDTRKAAEQIRSRQKAKMKMPSLWNNFNLVFPKSISVEQASSELTADYKAKIFNYNSFADLTGGFGIDTLYFSKYADKGYYIEKNSALFNIATYNFNLLKIRNVEFLNMDAEDFLNKNIKVDLIYIDPARRKKDKKVFLLTDSEPNVIELFPELIRNADKIIIKASPILDIHSAFNSIKEINQIKVISVDNECKEILLIYDKNSNQDKSVEAIDLFTYQSMLFKNQKIDINISAPLRFLYEPNVALLKSQGNDIYASNKELLKLNPFTHLYTSNRFVDDFFGRAFKIKHVTKYSSKEVKKYLPENKANISTRNFPHSVIEIQKKLNIKDGGDIYIFAVRDSMNELRLIICEKIKKDPAF